jgi:signal transduction histidine kinase
VFAAVAEQGATVGGAELSAIVRFEPDGTASIVAAHGWGEVPLDRSWTPEPPSLTAAVLATGDTARCDDYASVGISSEILSREGVRSGVATPIHVEGRLWGEFAVLSARGRLRPDTEQRMTDFAEIVATAIANAEQRAQLAASRARVVTAADETRRRLERDLHDGAQQRLVSLTLELRVAQDTLPAELSELRATIAQAADGLTEVLTELREISRGIHPAILSEGGLAPALRTLARRSAIPVQLDLALDGRYAEPVEVAAYYVVSEALANTTKHAGASQVDVHVEERTGKLLLSVRDDGAGGADPERGSGLIGLRDRVEALGGRMDLTSHPGRGTAIHVSLPARQHEQVR